MSTSMQTALRRRMGVPVWLLTIALAFVIGAAISFASADEPLMFSGSSAPPPPASELPFSCLQPVVGHC